MPTACISPSRDLAPERHFFVKSSKFLAVYSWPGNLHNHSPRMRHVICRTSHLWALQDEGCGLSVSTLSGEFERVSSQLPFFLPVKYTTGVKVLLLDLTRVSATANSA
eukprot:343851-Amphidinium_carterae.1